MQQITVTGNLGKKGGTLDYTEKGTARLTASLGSSKYNFKTREEETIWYDLVMWGERAERDADKWKSGSSMEVVGDHNPREYVNKDGEHRVSQGITVNWWGYGRSSRKDKDEAPAKRATQHRIDYRQQAQDDVPY